MKEQLIIFETAKLAKEKGFNISTLQWYHRSTKKLHTNDLMFSMNKLTNNYSVPTQSLLRKWLREVHYISINIDDYITDGKVKFDYRVKELGSQDFEDNGPYKTYEEALEKGLEEALKLIKI